MGFGSLKNDEDKKDSESKLDRLNELKGLNRLNRLKKINTIKFKKIFKSNNNSNSNNSNNNTNLKRVKSVISYISNKIDDLIVVNNDKNSSKNSTNDKNIDINTKNNISENIQDKNLKGFGFDFSDKIEEDFDDEYYRRIEPTEEEIKHENYLKSLDRTNLKNNKRNTSNGSNDLDSFSKENDNFDKYFPRGIPKLEAVANEPRDFKQEKSRSISSGPLSDKFGNMNKVEKEKNEKLDFKYILKLDKNPINKNPIKKFKNSITNDDDSKTVFGAAIFGLILIVLLFSAYYFLFYQPYQDDLSTAKTNKLNELNSLFKGPLALDPNVLVITSEIELAKSPEEVKTNLINYI